MFLLGQGPFFSFYVLHVLKRSIRILNVLDVPYPSPRLSILVEDSGPALMIQITQSLQIFCSFNCCWTAWCSNDNHAAMVIYCHMHLYQYVEYLEVDLTGSKAINQKEEKIYFLSCLEIRSHLNLGTWTLWPVGLHLYCIFWPT